MLNIKEYLSVFVKILKPLQVESRGWELFKAGLLCVRVVLCTILFPNCSLCDGLLFSTWHCERSMEIILVVDVFVVDDPWSSLLVRTSCVQFYIGCRLDTTEPVLNMYAFFHIITVAYTNVHAHRPKQVMAWSHILRKMSHKNGSIYINGIITNNNHCTVIFHYNGWLLDPARCRLSTMRASGNRSQLPCFPKQANPLTTKLF